MKKKISMSDLNTRLAKLEKLLQNNTTRATAGYNNGGVDFPSWPESNFQTEFIRIGAASQQVSSSAIAITDMILESPDKVDQILDVYERVVAVERSGRAKDDC